MFNVYIIQSTVDQFRYTGYTTDIKKRLYCHNNGLNRTTKNHIPLKLIYPETYINEKDARIREKFLKSGRGREVIKHQLKNTLNISN